MTYKQSARRFFFTRVKSAIVMVETGETSEQAWRRHIKNHPEDQLADVKIFHFIIQEPH